MIKKREWIGDTILVYKQHLHLSQTKIGTERVDINRLKSAVFNRPVECNHSRWLAGWLVRLVDKRKSTLTTFVHWDTTPFEIDSGGVEETDLKQFYETVKGRRK